MSYNMQMKYSPIQIIVKFFYPVAAGIETNIMETYSVLAAKGWPITVHTTVDTLTERNVLKPKETLRGLKVRRYPWTKLGYTPDIQLGKPQLVCLHNFNIVPHFQIMLKALWHRVRGVKNYALILTPHGGYNPEWSTFPIAQRLVKRTYHKTIGKWLINASVDGVRAVSAWEKAEMVKAGLKPELVTVIDNGIENLAFSNFEKNASPAIKKQVKSWGRYLIQIARIHPIKNMETIVKALPLIPSDLKFVIIGPVGDQGYQDELQALAKTLGVGDRLIFAGVVRGADKYYALKHAAMMTHMALWESYCNAVHEGMSQGLVCLVANNTALPLLIKNGQNGYCIETHDVVGLADKINMVLNPKNKKLVKKIHDHNQMVVRQHSWDNVAKTMEKFYQSIFSVYA